ncbi:hypothetical protein GE09DRAFT_1150036 [Coniochaeta sp. 2T2.1]|nr:hypothetical protein GE09DRAFT_1150036 [Coniochaeta sp. 2T2.1]
MRARSCVLWYLSCSVTSDDMRDGRCLCYGREFIASSKTTVEYRSIRCIRAYLSPMSGSGILPVNDNPVWQNATVPQS